MNNNRNLFSYGLRYNTLNERRNTMGYNNLVDIQPSVGHLFKKQRPGIIEILTSEFAFIQFMRIFITKHGYAKRFTFDELIGQRFQNTINHIIRRSLNTNQTMINRIFFIGINTTIIKFNQ